MSYCGSILRISIVDVTVISNIASVACRMQTKSMCTCVHGLMVRGSYFISLCSSSAGHVMYDV